MGLGRGGGGDWEGDGCGWSSRGPEEGTGRDGEEGSAGVGEREGERSAGGGCACFFSADIYLLGRSYAF